MAYRSLLEAVPWRAVGVSALQTFLVFWLAMFGLRLAGRRTFGELGPQDVVLLLLLSEALNSALVHADAGFWGGLGSAATLLVTVALCERVRPLRRLLDDRAVLVVIDGRPLRGVMARYRIDDDDLAKAAHEYGVAGPEDFRRAYIEGDGSITAVLKPERHAAGRRVDEGEM